MPHRGSKAKTAAREGGTKYPLLGPTTTSKVPKITKVPRYKGKPGTANIATFIDEKMPKPKVIKFANPTKSVSIGKQSKKPPKGR